MKPSRFLGKLRPQVASVDAVFSMSTKAKLAIDTFGKDHVINATLGALYDDQQQLVTFPSVYQTLKQLPDVSIASYASSLTAPLPFARAVKQWVLHHIDDDALVIATPGASGAIALAFRNSLNQGDTVLIPSPGWSPFVTIANEHHLTPLTYQLFNQHVWSIQDLAVKITLVRSKQNHVMIVVNDPAHNPTGYTLSDNDWDQLINLLHQSVAQGPITLLLDLAYLDYSHVRTHYAARLQKLAALSPNLLVLIAWSGSKTLTAYGMRLGALLITGGERVDREHYLTAASHSVRGLWSVANSGAMALFAELTFSTTRLAQYEQDLKAATLLLSKRHEVFIREAHDVHLPLLPFVEGFFVMVATTSSAHTDRLQALLINDHIYAVAMEGGLRLALCSIPTQRIQGLAKRIHSAYLASHLTSS
jgi:aspartate aminotransferase/aromatic-amino-acid transaminase